MTAKVVERVARELQCHCNPAALLLVGSAARAPAEAKGIDLMLLSDRTGEGEASQLRKAFCAGSLTWRGKSDDIFLGTSKEDVPVSVAVFQAADILAEVAAFRSGLRYAGEKRFWAAGCRLPEGLAGDIASAQVLFDPAGVARRMKDSLSPYPAAARTAILDYCLAEIRLKSESLQGSEDHVARAILAGDVVAALVRVAGALEGVYVRTLKHTDELARSLNGCGRPVLSAASQIARSYGNPSELSDALRSAAVACGL